MGPAPQRGLPRLVLLANHHPATQMLTLRGQRSPSPELPALKLAVRSPICNRKELDEQLLLTGAGRLIETAPLTTHTDPPSRRQCPRPKVIGKPESVLTPLSACGLYPGGSASPGEEGRGRSNSGGK